MHTPLSANQRITAIDALRGFCLLGILFAHFIYWHSGGPLPVENYEKDYGVGSSIATWVNNILIFGKFFALFSFLFGLSFFLQMESGRRSGKPFAARYLRRLFILLIIAAIHQTFWMGDILIIYVPLGFVLLAMRNAGNQLVSTLAVLLILNVPGKLWEALNFLVFHLEQPEMMGAIAEPYQKIIQQGHLADLWAFNWKTLPNKLHMQVFSGRLAQTLGYFLLGMYAGRKQWFEALEEKRPIVMRMWKKSSIAGLALLLTAVGIFAANQIGKLGWEQNPVVGFFFGFIFDGFNFALVIFYISGVTLLIIKSRLRPALLRLSPVGRMTLTSYLTQTAVGLTLFFGFGFGLFQRTSPGWNFGIAAVLFVLQVLAARWWFTQYRYGPVEWLWRCATNMQWLPIKRQPARANPDIAPMAV
jgi:uncharacterized protein